MDNTNIFLIIILIGIIFGGLIFYNKNFFIFYCIKRTLNLAKTYLDKNDKKCIPYLENLNMHYYYPLSLLYLIDIYLYGIDDVPPNLEKANELINQLQNNGNKQIQTFAIEKRYELNDITNNFQDQVFGIDLNEHWIEYQYNLFQNHDRIDNTNTNINTDTNDVCIDEKNYNDPQNVHDHSVIKSLKRSINKLKKSTIILKPISETYSEMTQWIKSTKSNKVCLKALNEIISKNNYVSALGMNEVDILNLVWNRIYQKNDNEIQDNIKNNLLIELKDGYGKCTNGRVSRLIDSLLMNDSEVDIKPLWVLKEEMYSKAANIRNEMYNQLPYDDQKKVDSNLHFSFNENCKKNITDALYNDYVKEGLMEKERFETELNDWIEDI
jgi:hypothetical protein